MEIDWIRVGCYVAVGIGAWLILSAQRQNSREYDQEDRGVNMGIAGNL